eukprot:2012639-Pleurochrysis_carterae.AAC.1
MLSLPTGRGGIFELQDDARVTINTHAFRRRLESNFYYGLGSSLAPPMRAGGVENRPAPPAGLLRIEGSWRTGSRAAASRNEGAFTPTPCCSPRMIPRGDPRI